MKKDIPRIRPLGRSILIFGFLLAAAIALLLFWTSRPSGVAGPAILPVWMPAAAVLILLVSLISFVMAGRALLRRREQNLHLVMSMPAARPNSAAPQPDAVKAVAAELEQLGFTLLGESDTITIETLDRLPVWLYGLRNGAIRATVMKHPLASSAVVGLMTSFPDGMVIGANTPRGVTINEPDYHVETHLILEEAVRWHTERVDAVSKEHGQPQEARTPQDAISLAEEIRSRTFLRLVNKVQDQWRRIVNGGALAGVLVLLFTAATWLTGLTLLVVIAVPLAAGMTLYLMIQTLIVAQIGRMTGSK